MATWIVHLRIADNIINQGIILQEFKEEFIAGSLAPDCGYGKKDSFGEFTPPPSVTHWAPDGCKIFCEYTKFYDTYLKGKEKDGDYCFYLGYYIHLITDVLWSASVYMPTRFKYAAEYANNPEFLNTIKKDWYGLDFLFLNKHKSFEPFDILQNIDSVKDYLPYYEEGQLTKQIRYIADYYKNGIGDIDDSKYIYMNENEMTAFIDTATELIIKRTGRLF